MNVVRGEIMHQGVLVVERILTLGGPCAALGVFSQRSHKNSGSRVPAGLVFGRLGAQVATTRAFRKHLEGYRGILQVGGYAACDRLTKAGRVDDGVLLAGYWSHVRRKFYELHAAGSSQIASRTVEIISRLWAIEDGARGHDQTARSRSVGRSLWEAL